MALNDDKSLVDLAKERFERAKEAYSRTRPLAVADTMFVMGDSDNGWQWPEELRNIRTTQQRACLTVNMTAQHCNQIINEIRSNRPSIRVLPADDGADKKTAEILAGMIRSIHAGCNASDAHDVGAEHAIYGGEGYWRVLTEYESPTSFNQRLKIQLISNPQQVYIDPDAKELDKSDARWGFYFDDITRDEASKLYPDVDASSWAGEDPRGWVKKDSIRIAEYYYCEDEDDEALLLNSGATAFRSEVTDDELALMGLLVEAKRKTTRKRWKWCKLIGGSDEPIDERDWLGQYLPIITVVGKEVNVNGDVVRKGIVRDLKDPARMVNYSYSAAVETIALQNKVPYMAAAEAVEGYENIWGNANNENRAYLPYNAFGPNGEALPVPQRQQQAVMPAAQVQMLQLSTEQMRAASGQQNANFGIKSEAQSGIGIQRLKSQGEIATFHFPDNLSRALRYEGRVLIDLIPKVYDTKRVVRILGLDDKEKTATLDPSMDQPYAEGKVTEKDVEQIFNPLLGMYDVLVDTGPNFATQRQEAFAAMTELAGRSPQLMEIAGDLIMRAADFPMAEQLAERLEKVLPPGLRDNKQAPQLSPEVQQQMQQLTEQVQQLSEALEAAAAEAEDKRSERGIKAGELQVKAYSAETERLKVVSPAMGPAEVQAIVMKTIQELMAEQPPPADFAETSGFGMIEQNEPPEGGVFMPEGQVPAQSPGGFDPSTEVINA